MTDTADLVLMGGRIVTMDETVPEAQAIAMGGGRILAVGSDEDVQAYVDRRTRMIDLDGRLAVPGLIDSHAHFLGLGRTLMRLPLREAEDWDGIVAMVQAAAQEAAPGDWILGRGWHQEKWARTPEPSVNGLPVHDALSAVSPDNPVLLVHESGHSCIANARAMELAGIDRETRPPVGGEIVRDVFGDAIGVFRETAMDLIRDEQRAAEDEKPAEVQAAEQRRHAALAAEECLRKGITTLHDAGASFETIDLLRDLAERGELGVRLYVMVIESNAGLAERLADYRLEDVGDHRLTVRSVKRLIDGALGSHGAWLLEPYTSLPDSTGLNTESLEDMAETARLAAKHGFQLCTHAIGDRANRETLDLYQAAFEANPGDDDRRWRIEHAQHLHPDDIPRFAQLGVIASMQGIHCTSDAPWIEKRLGAERASVGAYAWRSLLDTGAVLCNGTDAPVEDLDPLDCFRASVTRRTADGEVFHGDQVMTRMEALRSYTMAGAYAAFEEAEKGSLTPGKLADVVVLSRDILSVPDEELPSARVLLTILGGRVAYQAPGDWLPE